MKRKNTLTMTKHQLKEIAFLFDCPVNEVAKTLGVDVRTVRRWKTGESGMSKSTVLALKYFSH